MRLTTSAPVLRAFPPNMTANEQVARVVLAMPFVMWPLFGGTLWSLVPGVVLLVTGVTGYCPAWALGKRAAAGRP